MEVGKTLHVTTRKTWLQKNHAAKKEIWLVYPLKHTGKRRIPYNDAVEEALWHGSTASSGRSTLEALRSGGRREVFEKRLGYFLKMTAQNKRFGMVN